MTQILSTALYDATLVEGFTQLKEPLEGRLGIYELKYYPKLVFISKGDKVKLSIPLPLVKNCQVTSVEQGRFIKKDNKMITIEVTDNKGTYKPVFDIEDKYADEVSAKINRFSKIPVTDTRNHKAQFWYKEDQIKLITIDPWSTDLQQGETILWSISFQKGIINKTTTSTYFVTNYRIFGINNDIQEVDGLLLMSELDDVVVANTVRHSESTSYGSYYGYGGRFVGISGPRFSSGTSKTTGDVYFMCNGEKIISLGGISDPTGLSRLVKSLKKQLYPQKEIERFLKQQEKGVNEEKEEKTDGQICPSCGTKNLKTSNFCNKCGVKLRVDCSQCGAKNSVGSSFCNKCGFTLN
ncbi:MAG TPA: zinc-ribbon domain-containing protein [Candidatus Nitrosotenuis sp.]|jgi:ribosomal protein L40E|nr:zinc-ribbon domain-containing protein [Candidatus Nitrosotenuis sp.]